jgi:hypothetical protein
MREYFSMSEEDFEERYRICGPSIRLIFSSIDETAIKRIIEASIKAISNILNLPTILRGDTLTSEKEGSPSLLFKSSLLSIIDEKNLKSDDLDFVNTKWTLSSEYILKQVIDKFLENIKYDRERIKVLILLLIINTTIKIFNLIIMIISTTKGNYQVRTIISFFQRFSVRGRCS